MDLIEKILLERPTFHRSETEIERPFDPSESHLPEAFAKQLASGTPTCHGIEPEVAHYLANSVGPGTRTLETGAGLTTLIFAIKGAVHVSISPNLAEIDAIRQYAQLNSI